MKLVQATATTLAVLTLAACGQGGSGLTGATRDAFVQSSTSSCTQAARSDPRNASMSAGTISTYCTCYSNKMADTISEAELAQVNANPTGAQALLQSRIDAAVTACRPATPQ